MFYQLIGLSCWHPFTADNLLLHFSKSVSIKKHHRHLVIIFLVNSKGCHFGKRHWGNTTACEAAQGSSDQVSRWTGDRLTENLTLSPKSLFCMSVKSRLSAAENPPEPLNLDTSAVKQMSPSNALRHRWESVCSVNWKQHWECEEEWVEKVWEKVWSRTVSRPLSLSGAWMAIYCD